MGYIIAIVVVLLVLPLIFMMLSRRTSAGGGARGKLRRDDVTVIEPSSDQPTPRPGQSAGDQRGADRGIPPG